MLQAMQDANQEATMTEPVPYRGIQFVAIPEFQDLGTRVGQQMSAAIAGQVTVEEALAQSQRYAETVAASYQADQEEVSCAPPPLLRGPITVRSSAALLSTRVP